MLNISVGPLFNDAIILFTILGLGAMAGFFCERVGIVNIAIDGQMIFGALICSIFGMLINQYTNADLSGFMILVPILCSVVISFLLSWIYGILVIKIKANHVVSGTAINLVVAGIATFFTKPLGSAISGGSIPKLTVDVIPEWKIVDGFFGETIMIILISIILIAISIFLINKTRFGLRFKSIGDNPNAVDAQGVNVNKYKWIGMMVSGVFGAIAGSIFILNPLIFSVSIYFEGNVVGLGFIAIALVIFGNWRISFITLSSFMLAFLMVFTKSLVFGDYDPNNANKLNYISYIFKAVPFVLSIIVLIIFSRKGLGPKALGKHFDKTLR